MDSTRNSYSFRSFPSKVFFSSALFNCCSSPEIFSVSTLYFSSSFRCRPNNSFPFLVKNATLCFNFSCSTAVISGTGSESSEDNARSRLALWRIKAFESFNALSTSAVFAINMVFSPRNASASCCSLCNSSASTLAASNDSCNPLICNLYRFSMASTVVFGELNSTVFDNSTLSCSALARALSNF